MSFGGSVAHMIQTIKYNNSLLRKQALSLRSIAEIRSPA